MTQIAQAFEFGDKIAIAFPKEFGIMPGQKFKVKKDNQNILLIPLAQE